jgi:hypothetical protein
MKSALCLLVAVAAISAFADERDDRANLIGKWQESSAASKDAGTAWALTGTPSELHVTQWRDGQKVADYSCNAMGKECKVKDSGENAVVSFWYNGASLVQMETQGKDVTKRRFQPSGTGTMQVETIPIVPEGKTEVVKFKKVEDAPVADAAAQHP